MKEKNEAKAFSCRNFFFKDRHVWTKLSPNASQVVSKWLQVKILILNQYCGTLIVLRTCDNL